MGCGVPGRVHPGLRGPEHPLEGAVQGPPAKPGVQRLPRPIPLRHVRPGRAGAELAHDPVEHPSIVPPLPPPQGRRQQRPDELLFLIRQFMATYHPPMNHHSSSIEDTTSAKVSATALRPTPSRTERAPLAEGVPWDFQPHQPAWA